jgi:hypothetical protein
MHETELSEDDVKNADKKDETDMRTLFFIIILLHGLIHLMGFVKAFGFADISELTLPISRSRGLLWLTTALILVTAALLWFLRIESWWVAAIFGVIMSQILVFAFWQDARFGTILNVVILTVMVTGFLRYSPPEPTAVTEPGSFEERYETIEEASRVHNRLISPFELQIDPMERLLLINIEKDPDTVYIGFEPQVFDDEINGSGMLVIGWRIDGMVDVYHQPGLKPDPEKYDIAGKGLANLAEREMGGARFDITEKGVQANIAFTDLYGRVVELRVEERSSRTRKPFGLLAPMGDAAVQPSSLPLVLLHDFYFVRQSNTDISVKIDDRLHKPDKLPMPLDFSRMYFARYSPDPLILTLNPAFDGVLAPLPEPVDNRIIYGETDYELTLNGSVYEIKSLSRSHKGHTVTITFSPDFPNLFSFTGNKAAGRFEITGDAATGRVRGLYSVRNSNGTLYVEMIPSGGWIPNEKKLSLRFLYRTVPVFTSWPATYRWKAELQKDQSGVIRMSSSWERTTIKMKEKESEKSRTDNL